MVARAGMCGHDKMGGVANTIVQVPATAGGSSYVFGMQTDGARRRYPRCCVVVVAVVAALSGTEADGHQS